MQPDEIKALPEDERGDAVKKALSSFKRVGKSTKESRPELGLKTGIDYPASM